MIRLSPSALPATVPLPGYDPATRGIGIVHFGLGAFTRAHQAWYTDRAMDLHGGDWRIAGVSLRSPEVGLQLNPQGGLYTLATRSAQGSDLRVIGSIAQVLLASEQGAAVIELIARAQTHLITFTVTEKGYCRTAEGDLDQTLAERGFYPLLAAGLAARRAQDLPGVTLLSCDNLADNGHQLRRLVGLYLARTAPDLGQWVDRTCTFPCSMIDRIVPATTAADRNAVAGTLGLRDEALVLTEPFSQWVIEGRFAGPRPAWDRVGAQIVDDVAPYETAKLRMLNGAHSALAYLGLERGHTFVHEAVADPVLGAMARRLMLEEAAPTIDPAPGQDLGAYAAALLARFANPALGHRLIQIAMDGSQKIPQRWLATLAANRARNRRCPVILAALAAWLRHVRGDNIDRWGPVDDPCAQALCELWHALREPERVAQAVFAPGGPVPDPWQPAEDDLVLMAAALG